MITMISREEAIRILDPATSVEALAEIEYYAGFSDSMAVIKAMHDARRMGVEALRNERPKGRWVEVPDKLWSLEFKCSCCGRSVYTAISEEKVTEWYPYCHCGADMRGEEE